MVYGPVYGRFSTVYNDFQCVGCPAPLWCASRGLCGSLVALRAWAQNDDELEKVSDLICSRLTTYLYEYLRVNEKRPEKLSFHCVKECFKEYVRDEMNCCQFLIRKGQCMFDGLPRGCRYCHPAHWECSKYRNVFELIKTDSRVRHRDGRYRPRRNYNNRNYSDTSSGYESD